MKPERQKPLNRDVEEDYRMPVATEVSPAAMTYRQNGDLLVKSWQGLTPEEWLKHPGESSNHLLWIVGHLVYCRSVLLGVLGTTWSRPWLTLFARGAKVVDASQYPTAEEITSAWQEVYAATVPALEQASEAVLSAPPPGKLPSFDGKISGSVAFLAFHETYHVGQAAYLRTWLGHEGVAG
jgi:uncharacterized damage-inducible protein DinB